MKLLSTIHIKAAFLGVMTSVCLLADMANGTVLARFDVNSGTLANQTGYESLFNTGTGTQNGITLTSSAGMNEYRNRGGGGALASHPLENLLLDFGFQNDAPRNVTYDITGLLANTEYQITIYSYDRTANNGTTSDWYENDNSGPILHTHTINTSDPDLADFTLSLTSDGGGAIRIYAEATNLVIFNGMDVALIPEPSSLLLCGFGSLLLLRRRR